MINNNKDKSQKKGKNKKCQKINNKEEMLENNWKDEIF